MTVEPFVALMHRYVVDYTNRGDLTVSDEIMEPDYVLRMGPHVLEGRDEPYRPASRRHVTVRGPHRGAEHPGAPATPHAAALVTVQDGRVARGRVIRDRLGLTRSLAPAGAR